MASSDERGRITFHVGALHVRRYDDSIGGRGGGVLTVSPGALVVRPDPGLRRVASGLPEVVAHAGTEVAVFLPRLMPPWLDTFVLVSDSDTAAVAGLSLLARRRLLAALEGSGFRVVTVRSWFDRGLLGLHRKGWKGWD